MRHLNGVMVLVCCAALLFVVACADTEKKATEAPSQTAETPSQTTETPSQTAEASVEEVTLAVTGMT